MDKRPRIKTRHPGVFYRERSDGSRTYIIWYRGTDGRPRFENVAGGEKDAVRARAKLVDRIAHGHKVAPSRRLFADFAREWLAEQTNLRANSLETYSYAIEKHLVPRLGERTRLSDVDVDLVARLIASMQRDGKKAWTIRTTLTPLSRIMASAVRRGYAPVNPVTQLDRSERPKGDAKAFNILDSDEIRLVLDNAGSYRTLFATLVFTGVRIGELLALCWEDVDWSEGIVYVRGTKTKGSDREVVLMPALQQELARLSLKATGEVIFPQSRNAIRTALRSALKKAGVDKHIRIHDLRHTYASLMIAQGHDLIYLAGQMGHTNPTLILRTYGHLIDRKKKRDEARERMEASFGQLIGQEQVSLVEPN